MNNNNRDRPGPTERRESRELETLTIQDRTAEATKRAHELREHRERRAAEFAQKQAWMR
jgi:hypothetical protein